MTKFENCWGIHTGEGLAHIASGYFRAKLSPVWISQQFSNLVILHLPAYEDGKDRVYRNVGIKNSDAGELPRRKHTKCVCLCGCFGNMYTVHWLRFLLTWLRFFLPWLRFFRAFSSVVRQMLAKTGYGPRFSTFICHLRCSVVICFVLCIVCV